jgi:hypothetical protein
LVGVIAGVASAAAREAAFRLQAANSAARDIIVIPLDPNSGRLTAAVAEQTWRNARFVPYTKSGEAWRAIFVSGDVDLAVMIGQEGEDLSQAVAVGEICMARAIKTSAVLLRGDHSGVPDVSDGLRSLRPWTQTLAVIAEPEYLAGLLHALGA